MNRKSLLGLLLVLAAGVGLFLWLRSRSPTPDQTAGAAESPRPARRSPGSPDPAGVPAMLRDPSWKIRLAGANTLRSLTAMPLARRAELLVQALDREATAPDSSPPVAGSYVPLSTFLCLQYLGLLEDLGPDAAEVVRAAPAPASPAGREWRSLALAATGGADAASRLRELVIRARDPGVRMSAAHFLGDLGDRDAIPVLRTALSDSAAVRPRGDRPGLSADAFHPVREQAAGALRALGVRVERRGDTFTAR